MRLSWLRASSALHRFLLSHPLATLAGGLLLALLSILVTREHLEFWTERNVLTSQDSPEAARYRAYRREFKDDYVILVVRSKDVEEGKRFASVLGRRLEEEQSTVQEVFYRIPLEEFRRQALLFLEPAEIDDLRTKISKHRELLERLARSPGLVTLLRTVNEQISRALVSTAVSGLFSEKEPEGEEEKEGKEKVAPEDLQVLSSLMDSLYVWLTDAPRYRSPWGIFAQDAGGLSEDGFLVDEDRGWVFLLAYLKDVEGSFNREGAAIDRIREDIREISAGFPGVKVAITGTPALNSNEMATSLQDMTRAMGLALFLVALLFVGGFGETRRPLMAIVVLLAGVLWTLGWTSLTVGHLTILSMAFGSILVGLGIDFGIHIVARYEKERGAGASADSAVGYALERVGRAVLSGAVTTAAAFFALGLSHFRGIREFGWIAGWGILFCLVAAMTLLPVLLFLLDRKKGAWLSRREGTSRIEAILSLPARRPAWVLPVAVVAALGGLFVLKGIRFDYNLLHLQAKGTEAVEWERKLIEASGTASIFAADMADSLEEAREKAKRYEALPLVSKVESLAKYLPVDVDRRIEAIRRLKPLFEGVDLAAGRSPSPPSVKRVRRWVSRIRFKLREEEEKEGPGSGSAAEAALPAADTVGGAGRRTERVLRLLESMDAEAAGKALSRYQERLVADFRRKIELIVSSLDPEPMTLDDLPALLKKRFIGSSGRLLLQIYPKEDVWELEPQRRFIEQLRSINPEVTGPAVENYRATRSLLEAYVQGGLYAVCAVLLILLVDLRNPVFALLALIPLVFGGLWTLLGMRLTGMAFNPANLIIIPLLVGIGVDNGIHVVRHFLAAGSPEEEIAGSTTGRAVALSTLTTIAGFGSLAVARHQGIHSVGTLLTLAMSSCLVASLVVLPSLLRVLPAGLREGLWRMGRPRGEEAEGD